MECLNEVDAGLIGVSAGTPFMRTRRLVRDASGKVIEYVVNLLDPQHFPLCLKS